MKEIQSIEDYPLTEEMVQWGAANVKHSEKKKSEK